MSIRLALIGTPLRPGLGRTRNANPRLQPRISLTQSLAQSTRGTRPIRGPPSNGSFRTRAAISSMMANVTRRAQIHANRPLAAKKTRMIVVYGYGCDKNTRNMNDRHAQLLRDMNRTRVSNIDVMCNTTEPQSMTYDIWRRLLLSKRILEPTKFVLKVMDAVCRALHRGEEVILVGHSYGGSVASRIAMFIGNMLGGSCSGPNTFDRRLLANLRVVTFGSIFIPPPETTRGVRVSHYVYANDIAAFCHKQNRKCEYIKVLKPRPGFGPLKSHVNYDHLVTSIAQTASTSNAAINHARRANLVRVV